uniref:Aminoglycoside phosphotransferase domain-containing protein n=1 Tax=Bionectria ochroleuca TaxID=29856 RepID=A0A0B7KC47_BIOOC
MNKSKTPGSATYAVSRSRGKQPEESAFTARLREMRKAKGQARSSDESESEDENESGVIILHKLFNRKVVLHSDDTVVKSGKRIAIGEAEALKVAALAGIPAPRFLEANTTPDGRSIRMSYVHGESPDTLWPSMTVNQKKDIASQLRIIIEQMRSVTPPANLIGACDGTEIRDTRAFTRRLRTNHRVVLTHCDLAPRNILVQEGKIQGLVDWEDSGWYPEYWEYVKFFQRPADKDWKLYAQEIFPELYHEELVTFIAMSRFQNT